MTDGSDDTPGLLWRLDVKDRDGVSLRGYPRIFLHDREYVQHLGRMMTKSYEKNLGYTFIKEGCTRSAWMNLDGPAGPGSSLNLPEELESRPACPDPCLLSEADHDLPPVVVFYEAA